MKAEKNYVIQTIHISHHYLMSQYCSWQSIYPSSKVKINMKG